MRRSLIFIAPFIVALMLIACRRSNPEAAALLARADLTVRGFPQSVAQLRARLKIKEGGTAHLFATTLADGQKIIIKTVPEA